VGRWEGNPLVVDTTNFTNLTAFRGSSEKLHLVERFTRAADDTMIYQFTVEDPATWAKPSSVGNPEPMFPDESGLFTARSTCFFVRTARKFS